MNPMISVIVPVYNEGPNVDRIVERILGVFQHELLGYGLEIIFSDNASTDDTFERIRALAVRDPRVRGIRLSRNFGFQANILSGLLNARGDAILQLDADGEDPPELIPQFVAKWREGYEVVYGVRKQRKESWFLSAQRKLFYRLLHALADIKLPVDAGDFRLIDRKIADLIRRRFPEHNPYLRGLISFAGFRQIGIPYDREARMGGISKFTGWSYLSLAWDALTSFSRIPLKVVSMAGLLMSALSFAAMVFYLAQYYLGLIPVRGFATLILVILFVSGLQLMSLGIVGEYISRIFDEVKQRPRTIVADSCGFEEPPLEG